MSSNHKAILAQISEVKEIPGADRIQLAVVLGEHVVVSKEMCVGDVGVLIPVDLQLSEEFCYENNLLRDKEKNKDKEKAGFFEANRRVRAQPFLKVRSEGYFTTLDSFAYTGYDLSKESVGFKFDELSGNPICKKYLSEKTLKAKGNNNTKAAKKDYATNFAKHVDSLQFRHEVGRIKAGSLLSFHSKRHGTSFRVGRVMVKQELSKLKQLVNKLVAVFPEEKLDYVVGTRNVVLKPQDVDKEGFHGSEAYRFEVLEALKPHLEDNMLIFGEIVGFVNGKPIMAQHNIKALKNKAFEKRYGNTITYSYGCKEHEYKFFVYRVAYIVNGEVVDMSQKQLEKWCSDRGIEHTLEVHPQIVYDGDQEKLSKLVESLAEREDVLCEDPTDPSHIHEGIIIKSESGNLVPDFYKYKTFAFRAMESGCDVADVEDAS